MTAAEDSYTQDPFLNLDPPEWADDEETVEPQEIPFLATEDIDTPDDFLKGQPRPRGAIAYEKKIKRIEVSFMRYTIQNPKTVADAAAIITYGAQLAKSGGDLAAKDKRFADAVDFLSEGAGNPYLEFAMAAGIMAMQIMRNHEPVVEREPKHKIRIFKREFGLRIRFKLGRFRKLTQEPKQFTADVLGNPDVQKMLVKYHGIRLTETPNGKAK